MGSGDSPRGEVEVDKSAVTIRDRRQRLLTLLEDGSAGWRAAAPLRRHERVAQAGVSEGRQVSERQ